MYTAQGYSLGAASGSGRGTLQRALNSSRPRLSSSLFPGRPPSTSNPPLPPLGHCLSRPLAVAGVPVTPLPHRYRVPQRVWASAPLSCRTGLPLVLESLSGLKGTTRVRGAGAPRLLQKLCPPRASRGSVTTVRRSPSLSSALRLGRGPGVGVHTTRIQMWPSVWLTFAR